MIRLLLTLITTRIVYNKGFYSLEPKITLDLSLNKHLLIE